MAAKKTASASAKKEPAAPAPAPEPEPNTASAQGYKQAMLDVARKMKQEGMDIDSITKFTNLTKAEVRKA